jgi:hypothetical protein
MTWALLFHPVAQHEHPGGLRQRLEPVVAAAVTAEREAQGDGSAMAQRTPAGGT